MKVILAVTGGIAAYKTLPLTSALTKVGCDVQVVLTEHAQKMVLPLPYETLTSRKVISDMFDSNGEDVLAHINLARWADVLVVAPATANIIAKMAHGIADDFLSTLLLAYRGPLLLAPAMNDQMYTHPATQENLKILASRGVQLLAPTEGALACRTVGIGKMMEPEDILTEILASTVPKTLSGKHILVTAGPTQEKVDPVRYLSNHSSGKMGYAIAQAAKNAGASVTLVSGPVHIQPPKGIKTIPVVSTCDLQEAVLSEFPQCDALIMAAAPSDYRPAVYLDNKMKKAKEAFSLDLTRNPDILSSVADIKQAHQVVVGFAAESQNVEAYATDKLKRKRLDMIVANDITAANAGFARDVNTVTVIEQDGKISALPTMSKDRLSAEIIQRVDKLLQKRPD